MVPDGAARQPGTRPCQQPFQRNVTRKGHLRCSIHRVAGLSILSSLQIPIGPTAMYGAQLLLNELSDLGWNAFAQAQEAFQSELTFLKKEFHLVPF